MKKLLILWVITVMLLTAVGMVIAQGNTEMGNGWPYYVDVVVDWDGDPTHAGSWNVYAQQYWVDTHSGYTVGDFIAGCSGGGVPSSCLDMSNYNFVFKGKTLQFDEVYVPGVVAHPQTRHVVLHDNDGDGVYTGGFTENYYFPSEFGVFNRMDIIRYTVTTSNGQVTDFHYVEEEYKKPI